MGAARITGEVLDIMVKVPTMVNKMTGVDVTNVRILNTKKALDFSKMYTSSSSIELSLPTTWEPGAGAGANF